MSEPKQILDVAAMARVLGRTEASIRAAVSRGSPPLPKRIKGPRLLWRAEVVEKWMLRQGL